MVDFEASGEERGLAGVSDGESGDVLERHTALGWLARRGVVDVEVARLWWRLLPCWVLL